MPSDQPSEAAAFGDDAQPGLLSVCAPVFNEEELVEEFYARTTTALDGLNYELIIVNDGSSDATPALLDAIAESDQRLRVVHLSRNFGHQAALTAGLEHARGDAVAMIDADLQDPPELIPDMIAQWSQGADVVYVVREAARGRDRLQARDGPLVLQALRQAPRSTSSPTPATSACSTAAPWTRCCR